MKTIERRRQEDLKLKTFLSHKALSKKPVVKRAEAVMKREIKVSVSLK